MRGISMGVETLALATQLLETAPQRAKTVSREAERMVHDFCNNATSRVESVGKGAAKQLRTGTPPGTRAIQFLCGVGVGLAAGVLFTPSTGKQIRDKLFTKATRLVNSEAGSFQLRLKFCASTNTRSPRNCERGPCDLDFLSHNEKQDKPDARDAPELSRPADDLWHRAIFPASPSIATSLGRLKQGSYAG